VHELGTLPDGRPFFAMKLIKGDTLAELLARRPTPADDLPRFLTIFEQVCQTVAYAHARGVIHRDLKPSNVMAGAFGEVQVMDWGLAKALGAAGEAPAAVAEASTLYTTRGPGSPEEDAAGVDPGDAGVHAAGAGPRPGQPPRRARRRLRPGRHPLRHPDGASPVRRQ
jgi:serine/threonine protein kinase